MVAEGLYYGFGACLVGALAVYLGGWWWGVPFWGLGLFALYFFRDPERTCSGEGLVSPADGRVVDLVRLELPSGPAWKMSIFLNVFNVHVNRSPVSGTITRIEYVPGRFLVASRPEASIENEQNTFTIESASGTVIMKQIAGAVARRIVCYKTAGDSVARGERVGLIKFGSRVDLFFGLHLRPAVVVGDKVRAGETVIATAAVPQHESPDAADRTSQTPALRGAAIPGR